MTDHKNETCHDCGGAFTSDGCGTGYGVGLDGYRVCYACCGKRDRATMIATGRFVGYLTGGYLSRGASKPWTVGNWPDSLEFRATVREGRHNIARVRRDAWFDGPDGFEWHGVQLGNNSEIITCKRTTRRVAA